MPSSKSRLFCMINTIMILSACSGTLRPRHDSLITGKCNFQAPSELCILPELISHSPLLHPELATLDGGGRNSLLNSWWTIQIIENRVLITFFVELPQFASLTSPYDQGLYMLWVCYWLWQTLQPRIYVVKEIIPLFSICWKNTCFEKQLV